MSPALANHLLQSTIFAAAAGLLTLLLRNNHARIRYWIWLAASLKFLIPFSIFINLGHRFSPSSVPAISHPQLALVADEISRQFEASPVTIHTATSLAILPAIWIFGSALLLIVWLIRWYRVTALLRTPGARLEPGVFGIFRPVLYLPANIADHLDEAQLKAIIAHEQCHIRNRDNLTAALHSIVEAVFWFHPLTWWIGARLIEERERACDEEVVRLGSDPEVYAESILKICKLYIESPLACVPGITGSDLKKRIEAIMTNRALRSLNPAKKLALATACLTAFAAPVLIGIVHTPVARAEAQVSYPETTPRPAFEAASVKENHSGSREASWGCRGTDGKTLSEVAAGNFHIVGNGDVPLGRCIARNVPLKWIVSLAWQIPWDQVNQVVVGGPEWFDAGIGSSERYDIDAKAAQPVARAQLFLMLQQLLADRFALKAHPEQKELAVYELTIAKRRPGNSRLRPPTVIVPQSRPPKSPATISSAVSAWA